MARNGKLSLEHYGPGRWKTVDGRFVVLRQLEPINPMLVTSSWKIKNVYSIRDLREYDGPREFPEFAPEVGLVGSYREVYPWLGKFTGEGSFEIGNPDRVEAKTSGGAVAVSIKEKRECLSRLRYTLMD